MVAIKPAVGLTSRYGLYRASDSQDTVGILARSVKDAALMMTVVAGKSLELLQDISAEIKEARIKMTLLQSWILEI